MKKKKKQKKDLNVGRSERNIEIAKNMLNRGSEVQFISDVTGLTIKEIEEIK